MRMSGEGEEKGPVSTGRKRKDRRGILGGKLGTDV